MNNNHPFEWPFINNESYGVRYSNELLSAFQNQYKSAFSENIDFQVAEAELSKLARLVEAITPGADQEDNKSKGRE